MDDLDATQPVPPPRSLPPGSVTDSQMRNLHAAAQGVFATRPCTPAGVWQPPSVESLQKQLPQYDVTAFIARGGMGAVYKATQKTLKREVAVKVLPPDIDDDEMQFTERFKHEAQAMARLSHPNIVAVFDAGETTEGLLYFVMEFIEGTDVARLIASEGKVAPLQAVPIITAVCEALAFAHEEGIIHRDIKPSNIMLDRKGRVKVADFGLAKAVNVESTLITRSDVAMGTPDFIAPESLIPGMKVDGRADIYAVGVMLYQMLTGQVPRGRFDAPSDVVPQVDARFDDIVDKAMQTDRERRYTTATELKQDVESIASSPKVQAGVELKETSHPEKVKKTSPVTSGSWASALVGLVVLSAGGFFWTSQKSPVEVKSVAVEDHQGDWKPLYTRQEELAAFYRDPASLVSRSELAESIKSDPQKALRLEAGWLVPGVTEVRLPLPAHAQMGVRMRVRSLDGKAMDSVKLWRTQRGSSVRFSASCREMNLYAGVQGQGGPQRLTERRNPAPVPPGESFLLEYYAIGAHLVCRHGDDILQIRDDRMIGSESYLTLAAPVTSVEYFQMDGLDPVVAMQSVGLKAQSKPAGGQTSWQPLYTRPDELEVIYRNPNMLVGVEKPRPDIMKDPQAALHMENGWLVPGGDYEIKLPLPRYRNMGVRLRARRMPGHGQDEVAIWMRTQGTGGGYSSGWRGLTFYPGKGGGSAAPLNYRENPVPVQPGEEFTLEFYCIGRQLISRYNGHEVKAEHSELPLPAAHVMFALPLTSVEVLNLDDLDDATALKVVEIP